MTFQVSWMSVEHVCVHLTWNEECRPADDDKIVLPANIVEAHRGSLKQDQGSCIVVSCRPDHTNEANIPANCPKRENPMPMGLISVGKISET